ncbi:MAG: MFS transporter [Fimbriimonadales bacterium]
MSTSTQPAVWRRPAVLSLLVVALLAELGVAVLNVSAMPVYLTQPDGRGYKEVIAGVVMMAFLLSEALLKSYFGHLADRYGRLRFVMIAPLIWMVTPLLTLAVPQAWGHFAVVAIVLLRVFDGVAAAMLWPSLYAGIAEVVGEKERGVALSLLNVCFMVGLALGLPFGGALNSFTHSLNSSFYLASVLFSLTALTAALSSSKHLPVGKPDHEEHGEPGLRDILDCVQQIPQILALAFITFFGVGLPMVIIKLFAQREYGLNEAEFGALALPAALIMAGCSVPLGKLGERIGRARAVRIGLFLCSVGVCAVALGGYLAIFKTLIIMAIGGIAVGVGFLLALPAWYANVSAINPARAGSYLGAVMTIQGVGAILGLVLGSYLFSFNSYYPFIGCAAAVSVGWLLSLVALPSENNSSV